IRPAPRMYGATGLFYATGASTPTPPYSTGFSIDAADSTQSGLPHARGMGAARRHLARLAAQPRRLAGQVRTYRLGVLRNRAQAGARGARPYPGGGRRS